MMEMFKDKFDTKTSPSPTNPKNPKSGADKKKKKCPNCRLEVYHKPEACFERSQRRQALSGMDKQEKHLKVRGGQVHRALETRRG
jgi:hypothetical protein